jgi:methionine-rich copper-binding protein CopC
MTGLARGFAALLLVAFQMSLALPSASAHATLFEATPAAGSSVAAVPTAVMLRFNEPLLEGAREVRVTGPDAAEDTWTTGTPRLAGAVLSADLVGLGGPGEYTVTYRVTSADGHAVSGSTYFTLTTEGGARPAAGPAASERGSSVLGIGLAVGAGAVLIAAGLRWRRRRSTS